jgi:hypothetical protein
VADGTKVTVTAGNEENDTADVKNHVAEVIKQVARFSDLRFVGKSGRGKNFNLTITIHHQDCREIAVVPSVIKVTVDGPRDSRNASKCPYNPYDFRKRPASLTPFDLSLNLGGAHSLPSTSGLFDLTNSSAKRPRLNSTVNSNNNNIQNPIISNGNEFFKTSQISMPSIPAHLHPQLQFQHHQIFPTNLNLMMVAAAAMSQQQQQRQQHQQQQQQPFIQQQNMYNAYLTLYAAALATSLNPPSSSDSNSTEFEIKNEKKIESCHSTPTPPPTTNVTPSPQNVETSPKTTKSIEEKKVWRPFLSAE